MPSPLFRRRALATAVVLGCLAAVPGCGNTAAPSAEPAASRRTMSAALDLAEGTPEARRPNLLVIETDDMRWDDLRFMPHVRRLIQDRGLSFENSFAPYPLCAPSRSSFLTGRVRAQPRGLHPQRALRLRGVEGQAHPRHGAAGGGVPDRPGRQVRQRVRRAVPALRQAVAALHPAGVGPVVRRLRPPVELRRPELRRRDVLLRPPGRQHQRADPLLPRPLLHRRRRRAGARRDGRVPARPRRRGSCGGRRPHPTPGSRSSPTTRSRRARGTASSRSGTPRGAPTGSRAASTASSGTARALRCGAAPRPTCTTSRSS